MKRTWTEDDLEILDWCQSEIHGLSINRQQSNSTLALDLDYVIAWDKPQPNSPNYRVASALLEFRDVQAFQCSINQKAGKLLSPIVIDYIKRKDDNFWRIAFYYVDGGISFESAGFVQNLTSEIVNCHSRISRNAG